MRRGRFVGLAALLVGLAVVVAVAYMVALRNAVTTGDLPEGVEIRNGTNLNVEVFVVTESGESRAAELRPGGSASQVVGNAQSGCTNSDLVARTADGAEIDRKPPPFCVGEDWVIADNR